MLHRSRTKRLITRTDSVDKSFSLRPFFFTRISHRRSLACRVFLEKREKKKKKQGKWWLLGRKVFDRFVHDVRFVEGRRWGNFLNRGCREENFPRVLSFEEKAFEKLEGGGGGKNLRISLEIYDKISLQCLIWLSVWGELAAIELVSSRHSENGVLYVLRGG